MLFGQIWQPSPYMLAPDHEIQNHHSETFRLLMLKPAFCGRALPRWCRHRCDWLDPGWKRRLCSSQNFAYNVLRVNFCAASVWEKYCLSLLCTQISVRGHYQKCFELLFLSSPRLKALERSPLERDSPDPRARFEYLLLNERPDEHIYSRIN